MIQNIKKISNNLKSKIYFDYNLGKLTWFRTGGNAKVLIIVENSFELEIILNEINNNNYYILGGGSNILIRDKGYNGIVLKLGKEFNTIKINEDKLEVGSSILDINLSKFSIENNIEGFEFFSGIPGTIGGAIKMNAGCYGSETKDNIHSCEVYSKNGVKKILYNSDLKMKYRSSNINDDQIVTRAIFKYKFGSKDQIQEKVLNIKKQRLLSQPIKNKTSGSTFKNPTNHFAAKLIEQSDCKGLKVGDAFVSLQHSNFIINKGSATASDIENLGKLIIEKVNNKFDIMLDWEIKIIGEK
tara:strand:+ start:58 stop:954 length:897 start_codon:yes stop_codon:yes gene_type:complete